MDKEIIGLISGVLVAASVIPYALRTYQKKIKPNITSWFLWSIIGFSLLLTYKSSGAKANVWPAVFGFMNPLIITLLAIKQRADWTKLNFIEKVCLAVGLVSLGMWFVMRKDKGLVQFALYVAIAADTCAAIPTVVFVWRKPLDDRPFAWGLFSFAYGLSIFAISEHTLANYALPLYMFFGSFCVTLPLSLYRIKTKKLFSEWI